MIGYIYKTTNKIDGSVYIGQHKTPYFDEEYLGSGRILLQKIKEFGKENFEVKVLEWAEDLIDLNEKEEKWIRRYRLLTPHMYNVAKGGHAANNQIYVDLFTKNVYHTIHSAARVGRVSVHSMIRYANYLGKGPRERLYDKKTKGYTKLHNITKRWAVMPAELEQKIGSVK